MDIGNMGTGCGYLDMYGNFVPTLSQPAAIVFNASSEPRSVEVANGSSSSNFILRPDPVTGELLGSRGVQVEVTNDTSLSPEMQVRYEFLDPVTGRRRGLLQLIQATLPKANDAAVKRLIAMLQFPDCFNLAELRAFLRVFGDGSLLNDTSRSPFEYYPENTHLAPVTQRLLAFIRNWVDKHERSDPKYDKFCTQILMCYHCYGRFFNPMVYVITYVRILRAFPEGIPDIDRLYARLITMPVYRLMLSIQSALPEANDAVIDKIAMMLESNMCLTDEELSAFLNLFGNGTMLNNALSSDHNGNRPGINYNLDRILAFIRSWCAKYSSDHQKCISFFKMMMRFCLAFNGIVDPSSRKVFFLRIAGAFPQEIPDIKSFRERLEARLSDTSPHIDIILAMGTSRSSNNDRGKNNEKK